MLINKTDLSGHWEVGDAEIEEMKRAGWPVLRTSAKTGEGVEQSFQALGERLL